MIINVNVVDKIATVQGAPCIVCGNSDYIITFQFDAEWNDYKLKTARFVYSSRGALQNTDVLFEGDTVLAPVLSGVSEVYVGVYAGDLHTTTPARIYCRQSILCGEPVHAAPTPDVYNQLMERLAGNKPATASLSMNTAEVEPVVGSATLEEVSE